MRDGAPRNIGSGLPLDLGLDLVGSFIFVIFFYHSCGGKCGDVSVWVMKEYGVVETWTKQYIVNLQADLTPVFGIC